VCFLLVRIVIGSPVLPTVDQLLDILALLVGTVLPNLKEFPNLPSRI